MTDECLVEYLKKSQPGGTGRAPCIFTGLGFQVSRICCWCGELRELVITGRGPASDASRDFYSCRLPRGVIFPGVG